MTSRSKDRQGVLQRKRMVLKQKAPDFLNPVHERRRLFAEIWGTFLLVLVAAGGGMVAARSGDVVTLGMLVVASGLMAMAIIYFMGTVSGAHLNPAVTLAFALRRNFPWRRVPGYLLAQVIGGIAAGLWAAPLSGASMNPSAFIGAGPGARRSGYDVDLCGGTGSRCTARGGLRVDIKGETRYRRVYCGARFR